MGNIKDNRIKKEGNLKMNKKTGKLIGTVLIILLLAVLAYYYLLPGVASFLVFKTNLQHADVIIVLGGDSERLPYGVKLYKSNYSDKIIATGDDAEYLRQYALKLGIAPKDFILEDKATTTYENALFSRDIMLQDNFTSAIVVSSPYHMRRAAWLFDRAFKNDNITLLFSPVDNSWFKPDKWWTNKREIHTVIDEYAKFMYYSIMFGIRKL